MKYCEKCHVYVKGGSICPLCQTRLPGEGEPSLYPHISRKISGMNLAFRILLLISIAGGAACLALNRMLPESGFWSLYVILGILSFWIIFPLFCRHRGRVPRLIAEQSVVLLLLIIFWDGITGWGNHCIFTFFILRTADRNRMASAILSYLPVLPVCQSVYEGLP